MLVFNLSNLFSYKYEQTMGQKETSMKKNNAEQMKQGQELQHNKYANWRSTTNEESDYKLQG